MHPVPIPPDVTIDDPNVIHCTVLRESDTVPELVVRYDSVVVAYHSSAPPWF